MRERKESKFFVIIIQVWKCTKTHLYMRQTSIGCVNCVLMGLLIFKDYMHHEHTYFKQHFK